MALWFSKFPIPPLVFSPGKKCLLSPSPGGVTEVLQTENFSRHTGADPAKCGSRGTPVPVNV